MTGFFANRLIEQEWTFRCGGASGDNLYHPTPTHHFIRLDRLHPNIAIDILDANRETGSTQTDFFMGIFGSN